MQDRICGYAGQQLFPGENTHAIGKQQAMANQMNVATGTQPRATTVMGYLDIAHEGLVGLADAISGLEQRLSAAVCLDGAGCGSNQQAMDSGEPPAVVSARAIATKIELLTSLVHSLSARVVI